MTYLAKTQQLHQLLDQGKDLEALDQFFHTDLVVTEKPTGDQRHGIDAQKKVVREWEDTVETYHGAGTLSLTANEESAVSMAESWAEITFKGAPVSTKIEEVTVYRWEGDKVKTMEFYYHNAMAN